MTSGHVRYTCETFDEHLPDYLEGTLGGHAMADAVAHLSGCARCSALARDLEGIARDAAALPLRAPSRDLWSGIAERIEVPVVPLAPSAARRPRGVLIPRAWLGAMAAGLVALTAGVTYMVTSALGPAGGTVVAAGPRAESGDPRPGTPDVPLGTRDSGLASAAEPAPDRDSGPGRSPGAERRAPSTELPARLASATPSSTTTYDREIAALRAIVRDRSDQLDPKTLAILDHNIKLIDQAISESRAALARDPASRFLRQQLDLALDKKLELLRTAALLRLRS